MPPLGLIKAGVLLALLAGAAGYGYRHGAQRVQARWDKQVQADKDAADALRETNRLRARAAATNFETTIAAIQRRQASPDSRYALHATICPPPGAFGRPLELGDVPVPRAVLQRLHDAGADEADH